MPERLAQAMDVLQTPDAPAGPAIEGEPPPRTTHRTPPGHNGAAILDPFGVSPYGGGLHTMEKLGSVDPQRIGAYRLLGRLGAGGMGQVYLARSDRGRTVAIKLVREELAEQQEFRDRFRREVMAARRLGSTWTAPVLDADTDATVPWVATGYVAGPSLQATVSGRAFASAGPAPGAYGPLPERSVHILGNGLAHALRAIHTAGLIHRDLKPSNILLTIDGPRVIDFGIARAFDTVTDGGLTRTGALVGSPGFMSPEQVRGERVTTACDVFCLGSVLAYASTGRLPFGGTASGVHALMFRIAQEDPDLTGVPVDLVELVQHCLNKDPEARPTTDEILDRLAEDHTSEPWLPGALIAQLGRHAVELLDSEDPEDPEDRAKSRDTVPLENAAGAADTVPQGTPSPPSADPSPTVASTPPVHPAPGGTHALPTVVNPQQPGAPAAGYPAAYPAPAPGYGFPPQQSPNQGYAYGYPQQPGFGSASPYDPPYPTGTQPPAPEPARRRTGSTVALVVIAVLVAIGAGGSVYALMNDNGSHTASPKHSTTPSTDSAGGSGSPSPAGGQDPPPGDDGQGGDEEGGVPASYLGNWSGSIDNAIGHSTRELVIRQGRAGEAVLTLTAQGPTDNGGTYRCVFEADLTDAVTGDAPLRVGPSTVTVGEPMSSCTPGSPTTLTLLPDGTLSRENTDTGEKLTYTKSG